MKQPLKSFVVEIRYKVRFENEHYQTEDEVYDMIDDSSKCLEDWINQTAEHLASPEMDGFCSCTRMEAKVLREATPEDIERYKFAVR